MPEDTVNIMKHASIVSRQSLTMNILLLGFLGVALAFQIVADTTIWSSLVATIERTEGELALPMNSTLGIIYALVARLLPVGEPIEYTLHHSSMESSFQAVASSADIPGSKPEKSLGTMIVVTIVIPYLRLVVLYILWTCPCPVKVREWTLLIVDIFGKWCLVQFATQYITAVTISVPIKLLEYIFIDINFIPGIGLHAYIISFVLTSVGNQWCIAVHNTLTYGLAAQQRTQKSFGSRYIVKRWDHLIDFYRLSFALVHIFHVPIQ